MARVAAAAVAIVLAAPLGVSGTSAAARPMHPWLVWLHMTSANDGYALSGKDYRRYLLLRTSDGGRVWHDIAPHARRIHPSAPPEVKGKTIVFSRSVGVHAFAVERSDDGGRTWTESLPVHNRLGLGAGTPRLVDRRHLYVDVGEGAAAGSEGEALYTSSDGGHRWHLVSQTHVMGTREEERKPAGAVAARPTPAPRGKTEAVLVAAEGELSRPMMAAATGIDKRSRARRVAALAKPRRRCSSTVARASCGSAATGAEEPASRTHVSTGRRTEAIAGAAATRAAAAPGRWTS